MKIWGYIISNPDEVPVLPDALSSLSRVTDRIFVVDGGLGGGTLNHHPTNTQPLSEWFPLRHEFIGWIQASDFVCTGRWNSTLLTLYNNEFKDPAHQRNWTQDRMESLSDQPDWYLWIDSDEILSWQFINGMRDCLKSMSVGVTNITVKWLTLVQDEQHCVEHMSNWLAHARLYRPHAVRWQGDWHEHQNFVGARELWDVRIIHTRALFTERLRVQRGHDSIIGGHTPLWANARMTDIPIGVTWPTLHWPEGEHVVPFDVDVRGFYKE